MNRTVDDWKAINPKYVVADCSPAHIENLIADAIADIAELEAQLAAERERNANNVANADYQIAELRAEITRLREGGCAREQGTSQYCAEAAKWCDTAARYAEHIARMDIRIEEAKELLLQAHEPDQGQLRTQWDKDVDEWIKKAAHSGEGEK